MAKKLGKGMSLTLAFGIIAVCLLIFAYSCSSPSTETLETNLYEQPGEMGPQPRKNAAGNPTNPLSVNAACYVCHIDFVKEQISKAHLSKNITCIACHGLSAGHANDENVGATPPDIIFGRDQVDTMCAKCHKRHKISAQDLAKYESRPVCTDCHGSHRIGGAAD